VKKFKWLAEKNVVSKGGLWLFKSGRQKVKELSLCGFPVTCTGT
jgi:hypothetical protein